MARKVIALSPWTAPTNAGTVTTTGVSNNQLLAQQKVVIWDYLDGAHLDEQFNPNFKVYAYLDAQQ